MDHIFTAQALRDWVAGDPQLEELVAGKSDDELERALAPATRTHEDAFFAVWDGVFSQAARTLKA